MLATRRARADFLLAVVVFSVTDGGALEAVVSSIHKMDRLLFACVF